MIAQESNERRGGVRREYRVPGDALVDKFPSGQQRLRVPITNGAFRDQGVALGRARKRISAACQGDHRPTDTRC